MVYSDSIDSNSIIVMSTIYSYSDSIYSVLMYIVILLMLALQLVHVILTTLSAYCVRMMASAHVQ